MKFFIPNEENNHTPHLLRETVVGVLFVIIVGAFGFTALHSQVLQHQDGFLAAVLPSVLTDLTNEDRAAENLPELQTDEKLQRAARLKAEHMAKRGYFAHYGPTGKSPWYWLQKAGYKYSHAGENLAVNFADSQDVQEAWMNSRLHRENILEPQFREVGIATAEGEYKGQETVFVVQMFGARYSPPQRQQSAQENTADDTSETQEAAVAGASVSTSSINKDATSSPERVAARNSSSSAASSTLQTSRATDTAGVPPAAAVDQQGGSSMPSFLAHIATQPTRLLQIIYGLLATLIAMALAGIVVEYRRHHVRHMLYGVGLVIVMALFMYLSQTMLMPVPVIG